MQFDLEYSSRRTEVMKLYWRSWRQGLWKIQARVLLAVAAALLIVLRLTGLSMAMAISAALFGGLVSIAWLPLFPLWKFKPQRRTLTVDGDGLRTAIGNQSGEVKWSDFAMVAEDGGNVVLTRKNGNAFLIPPRAFESGARRDEFLAFVRRSVAEAKGDRGAPRRPTIGGLDSDQGAGS